MSFRNPIFLNYEHTFHSPASFASFPSTTMNHFSYAQFPNTSHYNLSNFPVNFTHSNLLSPSYLGYNSPLNDSRISQSICSYRQPTMNYHERFSQRNPTPCSSHFSSKKRNKWLKIGQNVRNNQHLLSTMDHSYSHTTTCDPVVYIHHRTPEAHLQGLILKISNIHLFAVATKSDKPARQCPHFMPTSLHIQAIHDENSSTTFSLDLQHLPHSSTSLFHLIQIFCAQIFSSTNTILTWGDVHNELQSLEQFHLFDLSVIINTVNLQTQFTNHWDQTHPHTSECLTRHQPLIDEPVPDDVLICLINSDDLDDEFDSKVITSDFNTCICPDEIRPYKTKNTLWSLDKAIHSSGLDLSLNTWCTDIDKYTRQSSTTHAITDLYFHMAKTPVPSSSINSSIQLNSLPPDVVHELPIFLMLTDSNGKYFPPIVTTSTHKLITRSISGLQWNHHSNGELCTRSLILSKPISSLLSSCHGVFLMVGTNSIRTTVAPQIIQQVEEIIDLIRKHHSHFVYTENICITATIPCFKVSRSFSTQHSLSLNLNQYNHLLNDLSIRKNVNIVQLPVTPDDLHTDGIHIKVLHLSSIYHFIQQYIDNIIICQTSITKVKHRSREAKKRKNQQCHQRQRQRQAIFTVIRPIARIWPLRELKAYLKFKNIHYGRLPEIRNHRLSIQFNHPIHQQHAEHTLTVHDFDEHHYNNWTSRTH